MSDRDRADIMPISSRVTRRSTPPGSGRHESVAPDESISFEEFIRLVFNWPSDYEAPTKKKPDRATAASRVTRRSVSKTT